MTDTLIPAEPPAPAREPASKRALVGLGLLVLLASAIFGADPYGVRERVLGSATAKPRAAATSREAGDTTATIGHTATTPPQQTVLRSEPWWQGVATLDGTGSMPTQSFTIENGAIQWRVKWTCQTGHLTVQPAGAPKAIVNTQCPGSDAGYGTQKGPVTLQVTADGPWQLQVEQQVDVPLAEPPLPAMTSSGATKVATGNFYRIDQFGDGTVTLYRLANGSYALRLENFYVTPNTDLEVQFNSLAAPRTTDDVAHATAKSVATLDVTAGSMNFTVPSGVNPSQYRSVVIWCDRLFSAYAAATLTPAS
jgi:hypothetical protein